MARDAATGNMEQRLGGPGLLLLLTLAVVAAGQQMRPTKENPLWEPSDSDFFGVSDSHEPKRYSSLSVEEFLRLGSSGVPVVVSDGCKDCPMKSWNCEEVTRMFSGVKIRMEYGDEVNKVVLGKTDWMGKKSKIRRPVPLPPDAPQYAPFYSDLVKAWRSEPERGWGDKKAASNMEKAIKDASEPYYFMDKRNARNMKRDPEFWLQPPETGSMAHMDEHCIPTIATTLSGVKRWRLAHVPVDPHPDGYFDGLVYDRGEWAPIYNFTTKPGESLIFPPGMIHEGLSVGEECVSSITYQFLHPHPVAYWRSFWPRLRRTKDLKECFPMVNAWATLNEQKPKVRNFAKAHEHATEAAKAMDKDRDGYLSTAEVSPRFGDKFSTEEALRYHDTDGDGLVSIEEFATNYAAWSAVELKVREKKGKKPLQKPEKEL
mmetsp:Transcript_66995/g.160528  ORF Transcript_66995/g.160528 Transcript_66995/m.160528 type:complete len:430 (-) Transcript_66995:67-1356(-)